MRARVLLVVALLALTVLSAAPVEAQPVVLQNDSYVSGPLLCYNGADQLFESVAAKFTAAPAQYPYTIDQISVLACGPGQDTYSFQIYNDNADTANPGTLIYSSPNFYVLTGGSFNIILMSSEPSPPPPITSGTIRVAIYNQTTMFNPVGFGADLDGIIAHRNFVSDTGGTWSFAENQGVTGDFILRLGIVPPGAQPALSIFDVTLNEGDTGTSQAVFTVALSGGGAQQVTVDYSTADGTATAGSDYASASGALTFPPGVSVGTLAVAVTGDFLDEADETFFVNLTNPTNATLTDDQGTGTIADDDPQPLLSVADVTAREGSNGTTTPATFAVTLSAPSGQTVNVSYNTADGTATAGTDYQAAAGALTFTPGATSGAVSVTVNGDDFREPDETFLVNLTSPTNAGLADGQATGTITDDDAWPELTHGQVVTTDLRAQPGPTPDADFYRVSQKRYASYEAVVDGVSGDLGAAGPALERLASDGVTVLQASAPAGSGSSRSLRWENATAADIVDESLRVRGTGCTITCGPEDVYRIRLYETTAAVPRFNNSASQVTVLSLQNLTGDLVAGHVRLWDGAGGLLATQPFSMPPHGNFVLNTASLPAAVGQSGSITVAVDAPYGALAGKSVAVEPSTGFSFDSPLVVRPR